MAPHPPSRCQMCREEFQTEERVDPLKRAWCERCTVLKKAPKCRYCGEPVRDAKADDPEPYHSACRRCASCSTVCTKSDAQKLAGRLFCKTCSHLFGKFFLPDHRDDGEYIKETFEAWDADGSGYIEKDELKRVLLALNPDFAERDLNKLVKTIDKNSNSRIEYNEFCEWMMQGDPLAMEDDSYEHCVVRLMQQAGQGSVDWRMDVGEVHVTSEGLSFVTEAGDVQRETTSFTAESLALMTLEPEEFIAAVEGTSSSFVIRTNTGKMITLKGNTATPFGPFQAWEGFHITGLRTKPVGDTDKVVGVDMWPLSRARTYDAPAALRFAAEHEYLATLREMLSKATDEVDSFCIGGVTALMLAAAHGNVGSLRMLVNSKADTSLCDEDGWTALTYASRYGASSAVDILISQNATEAGDGGRALGEAMANKNNSAARALLRAGFGPAAKGTFAVEDAAKDHLLLDPIAFPAGGNYNQSVIVKLSTQQEAAIIYYTLDGRDPATSGRKYRKPIQMNKARCRLRAVAMTGLQRSAGIEQFYEVCHYAMPDEVVSTSITVSAVPEAKDYVIEAVQQELGVSVGSIRTTFTQSTVSTGKKWLCVAISDPRPLYRLTVERSANIVQGDKKLKSWKGKFVKDVEEATGGTPEDIKIAPVDAKNPKAGFKLEFTLPLAAGDEMRRQLSDSSSYLVTKATIKASFTDADIKEDPDSVGARISNPTLTHSLHADLGKKYTIDEVIGVGTGQSGFVALSCAEKDAKRLSPIFGKAVENELRTLRCEFATIEVQPETFELAFSIDVTSAIQANGIWMDGGTVVKQLNSIEFFKSVSARLSMLGLPIEVTSSTKASSRALSELEFHLEWDFPPGGSKDYLDGICMVYSEEKLSQVVDFRSADAGIDTFDGEPTRDALIRCRSINRAVRHSGDVCSAQGGEHRMTLDLAALPLNVTDLYFVLSAYDSADLSVFPNPSVEIHDTASGRELTEYTISSAGHTQGIVMCSFSRTESRKWVVRKLGLPTSGNSKNYEPIRQTIQELQASYLNWERRETLVKMRVLHKLDRMHKSSVSEFADFLQRFVLDLPVPAFQRVVNML